MRSGKSNMTCQRRASRHAARKIHSPIEMISPNSSASGMKKSGAHLGECLANIRGFQNGQVPR